MSEQMLELTKEALMGTMGTEVDREIPVIDLSNFAERRAEIANELWDAATTIGFFQVKNHGIDSHVIDRAFNNSKKFFALPTQVKEALKLGKNAGYEYCSQIRPSTGTKDQKESYQVTLPRMNGLWPSEEELPSFKKETEEFEHLCWSLGMKILSCFATKLGFDDGFFTRAHNPSSKSYQSTLRMIHYFALNPSDVGRSLWRAGAHTDFDALTLLFQRDGQDGLQVCPGKDMADQSWTSVPASNNVITCNIGDMLMRWSDDKLKSNFHRVRNPKQGEPLDSRYSIAFFCQADEDALIETPQGTYPPITAANYLQQRIQANFSGKY